MKGRKIVLLSGAIAAGKSTVAEALVAELGYRSIRSGAYLRDQAQAAGFDSSRRSLQELGDNLDNETDYGWLIDDVAGPLIDQNPGQLLWLLDSARKKRQVEHFRSRFIGQILHVHLTAPESELRHRYESRLASGGEYLGATPYDVAVAHPNEVSSRSLQSLADIVVDTTEEDFKERLIATLERAS